MIQVGHISHMRSKPCFNWPCVVQIGWAQPNSGRGTDAKTAPFSPNRIGLPNSDRWATRQQPSTAATGEPVSSGPCAQGNTWYYARLLALAIIQHRVHTPLNEVGEKEHFALFSQWAKKVKIPSLHNISSNKPSNRTEVNEFANPISILATIA